MKYNVLLQLGLIVVSIVIVAVYIRPAFAEINSLQDQLFSYSTVIENASEYNRRLAELINVANSLSPEDRNRLAKIVPDSIDTAQLLRDIEGMVDATGASIEELSADELMTIESPNEDVSIGISDSPLSYQDITLSITGEYEALKQFLATLEANDHLFEMTEFSLATEESDSDDSATDAADEFSFDMSLRVYALPAGVSQSEN